MGSVVAFPERLSVDAAWDAYVEKRKAFEADPTNRELATEALRAFKVFADLFDKMEAAK